MISAALERSFSAPSTPTEQTKHNSNNSIKKKKKKRPRVHFPAEESLVTCYLDPPDPWSKEYSPAPESVLTAYIAACDKQGIQPMACVLDQLQEYLSHTESLSPGNRVFDFSLVGEKLSVKHCEALEEILRRIKFQMIDLEGCSLEDEGAAALFDMIEYYDSAVHLNISFIKYIDCRGWQACSRMLKKTNALLHLNARSTGLNEQVLLILGKALRLGSNLVTLHLENCGIFGRCLVILVAALKSNTTLRELFLAENKITSSDGFQLGNLLRTNTHLELLDLSNNKLQDEGLFHVMENLGQQSNTSGRGLSTLMLWNNELSPKGMACVAKALNSARTIKRFNLGSNCITSQGIQQLKQSFICNQTLEILELENCKITSEGACALAEYISKNTVIQKIDLRGNDIALDGVKALSHALMNNHNIISLQVDHTSINLSECKDRINEIQIINQYCNRNKEKMKSLPPLDVHLSTLFNGIFSRVLPTSSPVTSQPSSPLLPNAVDAAKTSQKSRFQVSPVCLEDDRKVRRTIWNITATEYIENGYSDRILSLSNEKENDVKEKGCFNSSHNYVNNSSQDPFDTVSPDFVSNKVKSLGEDDQNEENSVLNGGIMDRVMLKNLSNTDSGGNLLESAGENSHQKILSESPAHDEEEINFDEEIYMNEKIAKRSDVSSPCSETPQTVSFARYSAGLKDNSENGIAMKFSGKEKGTRKGLSLALTSSSSFDLPMVESKERRLSSPTVPTESQIFRKVHSIKCCKELEGLDLCSSMPLSPTKLYENFSFPQPTMEETPLSSQISSKSSHTTYMVH